MSDAPPVVERLPGRDGPALAIYRWPTEGDPRAACLLVHGYAEHAGRYQALARALGGVGVEVWALDLRGHGRSAGRRADVRSFGDYLTDVQRLSERVESEQSGAARLLFGHSMGGAIALRFALERPQRLDALVLSAPFLRPAKPPPGWLTGVARGLAVVAPRLPVQRLDSRALARDRAVVERYRSDPLVYNGPVRARMGNELVRAGPELLARAPGLEVPVLIQHGAADAIADPRASEELARAVPGDRATLRPYPGSYHEIYNDLDREAVTADLLAWLEPRLPAA